ncbi:MAG: hypothetical protein HeimAB125_20750 [Candidatus Heimdallarchaeota archaeon AB_125]|nr:MAG: hypothetical protein HeimAB125_20750 [Candidatus Heimdallarchaeota archaeon AB_125]
MMPPIIETVFPWEKQQKAISKKNQEIGILITINFIFTYFLLFVFTILGKLYPLLRNMDINLLGYKSWLVQALGYLVYNWWISIILFFVSLIIAIILSLLMTRTSIGVFRSYLEYMKVDFKDKQRGLIVKTIARDIGVIAGFSILIFAVLEFITFAVSSLIASFVLPIIRNLNESSLANVFLSILLTHILFFPLFVFLYQRTIKRKYISTTSFDLKEFVDEEGEVDMAKWRARTWGKKPYTFDWEEEDVFPITCFSCGSIISSNLIECPICDADLVKEIEEIDAEYSVDISEDDKEDNNQENTEENNDE